MKDINYFIGKKIAVIARTKEEAKIIVKFFCDNGKGWYSPNNIYFTNSDGKGEGYTLFVGNKLTHCYVEYFKDEEYELLSFKDFIGKTKKSNR